MAWLILALHLPAGVGVQARMADDLPPLPSLAAEDFPPVIREKVRAAYAAAAAKPLDAEAVGKLGMVLQAYLASDARAADCYRRARSLDARDFRWAYYLALVLGEQKKFPEAASTMRDALRLEPGYLPAQLKLAEFLVAGGSAVEARGVAEAAVKSRPASAQARYTLGRALAANHDPNGAVREYRRAAELFPEFGSAHYALALALRRLGQMDEATREEALYEKDKYGTPPEEDRRLAEVKDLYTDPRTLAELGFYLASHGKLDQAAAIYERALEFDPALARAHVDLISLYGRERRFDKAEEHYRAALRIDPGYAAAYYNYGVLLTEQGRSREAEDAFRKAIALSPAYAEAHNNLGDILQRRGKLDEAASEFRKAVEANPDFPQAHFNLGRILVNRDNYSEGIPELLKALEHADEDSKPSYLYAVGAAYARTHDQANSLSFLRRARKAAAARGQRELAENIEKDLRAVEAGTGQKADK